MDNKIVNSQAEPSGNNEGLPRWKLATMKKNLRHKYSDILGMPLQQGRSNNTQVL